jgi:hypothetical protein
VVDDIIHRQVIHCQASGSFFGRLRFPRYRRRRTVEFDRRQLLHQRPHDRKDLRKVLTENRRFIERAELVGKPSALTVINLLIEDALLREQEQRRTGCRPHVPRRNGSSANEIE